MFCARSQSPLPELQHDQRRADFLAGLQLQVSQLLAGAYAQPVAGVARELGRPLARPADDDDDALPPATPG